MRSLNKVRCRHTNLHLAEKGKAAQGPRLSRSVTLVPSVGVLSNARQTNRGGQADSKPNS